MEAFASRVFNLVIHQMVLVLLTYSLTQWFVLRIGRKQPDVRTRTRILELGQPIQTVIVLYYRNFVACLSPLDHQELGLTLSGQFHPFA